MRHHRNSWALHVADEMLPGDHGRGRAGVPVRPRARWQPIVMLGVVIASALSSALWLASSASAASTPPGIDRTGAPYWRGWDIARGVALRHTGTGGYVLDAWGGLHPFGGAPPVTPGTYTPGNRFAVGVALQGNDTGGFVVDANGVVSSFGTVGGSVRPCRIVPIRGISLDPTPSIGSTYHRRGVTIDPYGVIQIFCDSPSIDTWGAPQWNWPIARGVVMTQDGPGFGSGGFVVDGWGVVHAFGKAQLLTKSTGYWPGQDIARGIAVDGNGNGVVVDLWGGMHQFTYTVN